VLPFRVVQSQPSGLQRRLPLSAVSLRRFKPKCERPSGIHSHEFMRRQTAIGAGCELQLLDLPGIIEGAAHGQASIEPHARAHTRRAHTRARTRSGLYRAGPRATSDSRCQIGGPRPYGALAQPSSARPWVSTASLLK
jgi:hypothetical protein